MASEVGANEYGSMCASASACKCRSHAQSIQSDKAFGMVLDSVDTECSCQIQPAGCLPTVLFQNCSENSHHLQRPFLFGPVLSRVCIPRKIWPVGWFETFPKFLGEGMDFLVIERHMCRTGLD